MDGERKQSFLDLSDLPSNVETIDKLWLVNEVRAEIITSEYKRD